MALSMSFVFFCLRLWGMIMNAMMTTNITTISAIDHQLVPPAAAVPLFPVSLCQSSSDPFLYSL